MFYHDKIKQVDVQFLHTAVSVKLNYRYPLSAPAPQNNLTLERNGWLC